MSFICPCRSGKSGLFAAILMSGAAVALAFAASAAQDAPPASQPAAEAPATEYVLMETTKGDIVIELSREHAPISTDNFLSYVDEEYYDGTIYHRVIADFMIQGGGFTADMNQKKPHAPIKNEWKNGLKNDRGTIAMARTSAPDSATSQFYINVKDNGMLDMPRGGAAYAVFGRVVAGMDTVDDIRGVQTKRLPTGMADVPVETVTILKVRRMTPEAAKTAVAKEAEASITSQPANKAK